MPKPLESGTTTGCPSIQVGFHSFTQRIRVRKHLQDFLRHRRRTQGQGMDAPGWSRSASLCSLLWRNHPLSSQSHPSQPGPFSHWLGSYVRMCWRADTEHRRLSGVLTHHQSPWQSGVQSVCASYHFSHLRQPACFPLGWRWVVLNRMAIHFLHRGDKLLHMSCQMALEAQTQLP